ncbi:MAG: glycosyltransferase family 39 protein [Actinobacteria bacterium]|nr:glycosyltransferase family 39 protein [Actinomycetota bacterium]MBU1942926.1 glycosyltransferase family 39 protein [Actinomycetota bacterium]MBU2687657.1 glycosyltransferase family 39 protein [Actinomycetota bacterium]
MRLAERLKAEGRPYVLCVGLLTAVGFLARLAYLFYPVQPDEAQSYVLYASRSLAYGLSHYTHPNNHPLNTVLTFVSTRLLGSGPVGLRLPALVLGTLLIPLTYLVARKLYDKRVALLACALAAGGSRALIVYSAQSRGYIAQAFLFMCVVLCALYIKRDGKGWIAFAAFSFLAFYALPTTAYFFGAVALWLLVSALFGDVVGARGAFLRKWALACAAVIGATVLAYLPFTLTGGLSSLTSNTFVRSLPVSAFLRDTPWSLGRLYVEWSGGLLVYVFGVFLIGFLVSIVFHGRMSVDRVNLALVVLAWCALVLIVQRVVPFSRVWLPLLPLFFAFSSAGLVYAAGRVGGLAFRGREVRVRPYLFPLVALGLALLLLFAVVPSDAFSRDRNQLLESWGDYGVMDHGRIASELKGVLEDGDLVYAGGLTRTLLGYYFEREGIPLSFLYGDWPGVRPVDPDDVKRVIIVTDSNRLVFANAVSQSNLELNRDFPLVERVSPDGEAFELYIFDVPNLDGE